MRVINHGRMFLERLSLACRFFIALKYRWHLAWVKAERRKP